MSFNQFSARAVPLLKANVDTDQLLPKQFLNRVSRKGFGKHLFHDWRYLDVEGHIANPTFVLNHKQYQGAEILLAGKNFGCGSSREHAPWALADYGFKVIIAPSYADIFYSNCINNLLLPVVLPEEVVKVLADKVGNNPQQRISIDLPAQTIGCEGKQWRFDIATGDKHSLMSGMDPIARTLAASNQIVDHENRLPAWLD